VTDRPSTVRGRIRALPLTPEQLDQPLMRRLFAYWEKARGPHRWMRQADLRPEEFAFAMPYIALIERPPAEGPGLRIRLVGEEIRNEAVGYIRDRLIEEIEPAWYREHLIQRYRAVFVSGEPSFEAIHVVYDVRNYYYHRMILPLTVAETQVDIVVVCTIYTEPHTRFLNPEDHLG
jgi:hypothetical protein